MSDTTGAAARQTLGAPQLAFFVVAAAAPLGFALGAIPLALGRGGIGLALGFVGAAVVLGVFAVGYVAMAGHLQRVGGLYEFVRAGLGGPAGAGASFVALGTYAVAATGAVGVLAAFADMAAKDVISVDIAWWIWALLGTAAMGALGVRNVELNARVLGVVIVLEVAVLLVLAVAIVLDGGPGGLSAKPFDPGVLFEGAFGAIFAIAIVAFAGFEATVIYSSEVRDRRAIRRAAIGAIVVLAILYAFVSWAIVIAFGDAKAGGVAAKEPTTMFFTAAEQYVGSGLVKLLEVLVVTSWFASVLAFHNAASRYLAAMGGDGIAPARFAERSEQTGAPVRASVAHTALTLFAVVLAIVLSGDPYLDLYVLGSTPALVGIPVLEILACVAIVAFFARDRRGHGALQVLVAPAVAGVALLAILYALISELDLLTARTGAINTVLWGVVGVLFLAGLARGLVLARRPAHD